MGVKITQTNFTGGVIDPLLQGREDQSFYYNSLEAGLNLDIQPQGGARRRGGLRHVMELSPVLSVIDVSGAVVSAPQGGTAANAIDGDAETVLETSNLIDTTDPYVVITFNLLSAQAVSCVDLIDYCLSAGALDDEFFVQYSVDNVVWADFQSAFNVAEGKRSRRLSGDPVTAQFWRVVRIGATDTPATFSIAQIEFRGQSSDLSGARLVPFSFSTEESYMMALTDGHADVLIDRQKVGAFATPYSEDDLPVINWTQSLDTLLSFHPDHAVQRVFRQGGDDEFDFRSAEFTNIPQHDYGAGVGGVDEVQTLNVSPISQSSDDVYTILLEGKRTRRIVGVASGPDTAQRIQDALRALDNTSADGITVTQDDKGYVVTFGGDDGSQPWLDMSVSVLAGNTVWSTSKDVEGRFPGEDVFSDERGHPRCGAFYQGRLWMGGFKSLPNALAASVVGIIDADGKYDLDIERDDDGRGLLLRADTDQVSAIYQVVPGRNLTVFTEDTEFYIPNEPIDISAVLKLATRRGIKEGLRVFEMDGALVFIQADGSSLREFIFVDTEQSYEANNISVLSSHLLNNPQDMALRKAVNTDETDLLLIVNEDGTAVALSGLRKELVTAFTPYKTRDGDRLLNVGVDKKKQIYFVVERTINGQKRRFIEQLDKNFLFDGGGDVFPDFVQHAATADQTVFSYDFDNPAAGAEAIGVRINGARLEAQDYTVNLGAKTITLMEGAAENDVVRVSSMINEITGLDYLAGEVVQTYVDGSPGGDYTVSAQGVLQLNSYADISVAYGLFFDVYGKLMDMRFPGEETLAGKKMRVYRLILSLFNTGGLQIKANDRPWQDVPLQNYDTAILDKSLDETLFTGTRDIKGLMGFNYSGSVEFRQAFAAPLTVRNITREVTL